MMEILKYLKKMLDTTDFQEILNTECPDKAYNECINIYINTSKIAFPLKEINTPKFFRTQSPWITKGLIKSSVTKSKLLLVQHKNPIDENIEKYKNFCRIYKKVRRVAQANLYDEQIKQSRHDMKNKTWSLMKMAINNLVSYEDGH